MDNESYTRRTAKDARRRRKEKRQRKPLLTGLRPCRAGVQQPLQGTVQEDTTNNLQGRLGNKAGVVKRL